MKYQVTIGMEVHTQLATKTKMFCSCRNSSFQEEPNTNICPLCLGLPGTLPIMNKSAVELTINLGADVGATVAEFTKWDRKNYFYPDLPKGYQISQYDLPLLSGGSIEYKNKDGEIKTVNLTRIHLEEDTAKSIHSKDGKSSLIDYNRAGSPLLELVSEPEITSAQDARVFCETYQLILRRRGIANADMEKGEMRCEANISIRTEGQKEFGTKVEVKNLNSFKSVEKSIEYEIKRQAEILESGGQVTQETRGWDENKEKTYSQRKKETAADYRYFPEPDLPPVNPNSVWNLAHKLNSALPQPHLVVHELMHDYGLTIQVAEFVAGDSEIFAYWSELLLELPDPSEEDKKTLADATKLYSNLDTARDLTPNQLLELNELIKSGEIVQSQARDVARYCLNNSKNPIEALKDLGIGGDHEDIESHIDEVIAKNPDAIAKIHAGDQSVVGFLIGQIMQATKGQANPKKVREILLKKLS